MKDTEKGRRSTGGIPGNFSSIHPRKTTPTENRQGWLWNLSVFSPPQYQCRYTVKNRPRCPTRVNHPP